MNRFSMECSRKLFCMLNGNKKKFDSFCARHRMPEGHIDFTLSVCVCVSVLRLCIPESCPTYNFIVHGGV